MAVTTNIVSPIVTEKSVDLVKNNNVYTFKVLPSATSKNIATNVKQVFGVDVEDVRLVNLKGKLKLNPKTRKTYTKNKFKKAYVKVSEGQKIDMFETGE